jgi:hypothetical protein
MGAGGGAALGVTGLGAGTGALLGGGAGAAGRALNGAAPLASRQGMSSSGQITGKVVAKRSMYCNPPTNRCFRKLANTCASCF